MPQFDATTRNKINDLRVYREANEGTEVYELLKVYWPEPDGVIWYAPMQTDEVASVAPPVSPIEVRLVPESTEGDWFLPVQIDGTIGDEEIDLAFWDGDEVISQLLVDHGEGVKVEPYYWFPQAELLLPIWQGHLRYEDAGEIDVLKAKAVQGFRSADAIVPGRAHWTSCQAIFGGLLTTQAEIDEGDCPYNFHIGGAIGNDDPATSDPWTFCDRRDHASCTSRGVDPLFHLSHRTISMSIVNNQTSGPRLYSISRGNETNLKEPVRVVMGIRRIYDCPVMAFRRDLNNNNPDRGFYRAMYECCEGPIQAIMYPLFRVGGVWQHMIPLHYTYKLGHKGQGPSGSGLTTHGFSGVAFMDYNFGWTNPSLIEPADASGTAVIIGLNNIRVYTDDVTYTEQHTTNPVWQIMHILTNKRWGFGLDYARFNIDSWIAAAAWAAEPVRFTDPDGGIWDHVRARCDVELVGRKVQQQIEDICTSMRLSVPFMFDGKIHIEPLKALTAGELTACPVFTDTGDDRNVIWEGDDDNKKSTLKISRQSDLDLDNRVECTYHDWLNDHLETPAPPVEDVNAQLRAGRVVGDNSRKVNKKEFTLLGVTIAEHSVKCGFGLLDLGPLDQGGLANNCTISYKIWYLDALDLHPHKVIRFVNPRLDKYGFEYFRIKADGIKRLSNLHVEITAQAYPVAYMNTFEVEQEIDDIELDDDGGGWGDTGDTGIGVIRDTGLGEVLDIVTVRHIGGGLDILIEPAVF